MEILLILSFIDKGYIEGKKMDDFFKHMLHKLGMKVNILQLGSGSE